MMVKDKDKWLSEIVKNKNIVVCYEKLVKFSTNIYEIVYAIYLLQKLWF